MWGEEGDNPSTGEKVFFQGAATANLDAKGRLAIPVKYRTGLADAAASRVVVTINPVDKCLWLFTESDWGPIAHTIANLPQTPSNRQLQRTVLGYASDMEMDGQGRILISSELRDHAKLDKKVSMIGLGSKLEIWNADIWAGTLSNVVEEA